MAEAAAVAYGVFEAVETTAQAGLGAYMVAKPTMPLKAIFTQIATSSDDETRLSLARSDNSLSIIGTKAYIFGGETAAGKLAGNEFHVIKLSRAEGDTDPDYSVLAALPAEENGKVPTPRTKHAACSINNFIAIYGGIEQEGKTIDEGSSIWLFDSQKLSWELLPASDLHVAPRIRRSAKLFEHEGQLILYGGVDSGGDALNDVWKFELDSKSWTRVPNAPVSTSNAALTEGILYLVSANDNVSSDVHRLHLRPKEGEQPVWTTEPFPTNPLAPGPLPRIDAGLLHVSTGFGRNYLVHLFGQSSNSTQPPSKATLSESTNDQTNRAPTEPENPSAPTAEPEDEEPLYHSDTWTYQIASSSPDLKHTTKIYEALKPAALKDAIRGALGFDSGKHSWAEVEIVPPAALTIAAEGKVHPGPRAGFGSDVMADKKGIVLWGGVNPKGEREGDGWMVRFE